MQDIDVKVDQWKKRLLDLGKRNRLINFKETKRSNLAIVSPSYDTLYNKIVNEEAKLSFSFPQKTTFDEDGEEININIEKGDLETNKSLNEQQKTLKVLRARAKTSIEEQGINTLYLTFGIIKWKENNISDVEISSPIVLVPVSLTIESMTDPYILYLHEDEIVVNPSLAFKFENDFGIVMPEFDGHEDDITKYLLDFEKVALKNDWEVTTDVNLTLLSFLKINMYKDLDINKDKIVSNPIIKGLAGDKSEIALIPNELNNYDHDKNSRPIDTYQVVDADSSQQDAILLSKQGISFVLQGPPGTGKSQTITNIIAEAISEGKKVLFVSEKMAALEVVKKRLTEAGLKDFCLTLHSYKANKKEILNQLAKTLNIQRISLREDAIYQLSVLEEKRKKLNEYQMQLHDKCLPLNISIYEANGRLANLSATQDIIFEINDVENTNTVLLNKYKYLLAEFSKTIGKLSEDYSQNPWYGCNVSVVTHELRHDIEVNLNRLLINIKKLIQNFEVIVRKTDINIVLTMENIPELYNLLDFIAKSPKFPLGWLSENMDDFLLCAQEYSRIFVEHNEKKSNLLERYTEDVFKLNANDIMATIESNMTEVKASLDNANFQCTKDIVLKADYIANECQELRILIENLLEKSKLISLIFGVKGINSIDDAIDIKHLIELVIKDPQPLKKWFACGEMDNLDKWLTIATSEQFVLNENKNKIKKFFDETIIDKIDADPILSEFNNSYAGTLELISNYINPSDLTVDKIYSFAGQAEKLNTFYLITQNAVATSKGLLDNLNFKPVSTFNDMVMLNKVLLAILQNPKPTLAWFDENKDSIIDKMISDIKIVQKGIQQETNQLLTQYNKEILNIDYQNMLIRFNTEYTNFFKFLKKNYRADKKTIKGYSKLNSQITDQDIINVLNKIAIIKEKEQWLIDNKSFANEILGSLYLDSYTNWDMVDTSRANFKIIKDYFGVMRIPERVKEVLLKGEMETLITAHSTISRLFELNVLDFIQNIFGTYHVAEKLIIELLDEMKNTANNSLKIKAVCEMIMGYSKINYQLDSITIDSIVDSLNSIKLVNQKRRWFNENAANLSDSFGKHYNGEDTDWNSVANKIKIVQGIMEYFVNKEMPNLLMNYLISAENKHDDLVNFMDSIDAIINKDIIKRLNDLLQVKDNQTAKFETVIFILGAIENAVNASYSKYVDFSSCSRNNMQFDTVMTDIVFLNRIQEIEAKVEYNIPELQSKFDFMFNKLYTDWNKIISALEYVNEFKSLCDKYSLLDDFIYEISCQSSYKWTIQYSEILKKQENNIKNDFCWFAKLFDNSNDLYCISLYKLADRIEKGINNLFLLEEWIDFRSIRQQCRDTGLAEFVEKVEQIGMPPEIIVNTFLKRFYRLWLDVMIPRYPAIFSFRSRSHQSLINEFNELDKAQLEIARLRILERLISRLPNTDIATSSVDEVGILRRELTKQRKIMPLRRLFKAIPNLLTALKPCLMMSPLSVSLFLQADGYNFDMVIFDEASQVCTEDAIGAIMRGKQVIIAGDSKQLPPTSFFAATLSEGDYDVDTEENFDEAGAYDSILEEAVNAIPERTLKWHYRSRHEDLIAFSNAKIYNNQLITFPSNMEKIPDNGVEYVYVSDGVYDRGGKKHNLNEAKRVASLVFGHIKKYPNRSLGVVTFSEAQQQAVDSAIRHLRLQNSQYEKFFSEDNENEFFVKNLENVQGDERDTIIFSIGYAKDQNGVMYMNFGPLSRNGGHRRLNVAITRAKYNVKLVGSIHPTDIKIESTNSEGVKMLRQYIEFAINGASVLQNEIQFASTVDVESPFEEAVHDFLIKNGFNVATQVGCSGYRIDMAVKHPTLSGIFVLGIECDGATYHSARTARERDRLRQTVLEDIGWTIYRIWSTDWIKDPKTEGNKLIEAVKKSISDYQVDNLDSRNMDYCKEKGSEKTLPSKEEYITIEKADESSSNEDNPYKFNYYEETNVYEIPKISSGMQYLANVINYVVEKEAPIHYELLCKRVAPLFGNQKVTVKVRNSVDYILNKQLNDLVLKKEEFCWHKSVDQITVKIPSLSGEGRAINYISKEELAEAMFVITGNSFGISKSNLYTVTARAFGFNRTGASIVQSMEEACIYLLENGRVRKLMEKLFCKLSRRCN